MIITPNWQYQVLAEPVRFTVVVSTVTVDMWHPRIETIRANPIEIVEYH